MMLGGECASEHVQSLAFQRNGLSHCPSFSHGYKKWLLGSGGSGVDRGPALAEGLSTILLSSVPFP